MPFAVNGVTLQTPDKHNWVDPSSYGTSLAGRVLYPGVFSYELNWPMLQQDEFNVLTQAFASGTAVATLPKWRGYTATADAYQFESYTGTYLELPTFQTYFDGYYNGVKLVINHVVV